MSRRASAFPTKGRAAFLALAVSLAGLPLPPAHGAGFTYQGELVDNGVPLTGTADFRISLWDAAGSGSPPVGGTQIGGAQLLTGVPVTDGIFTVLLNDAGQFGAAAFNGDARWLQVDVCDDPACVSFTTNSPRSPVAAAPSARFSAAPWETNAGNTVLPGGSVGIGTVAPEAALHLVGGDILAGANDSEWLLHTRSQANGDFLRITDLDGGVIQFQRGLVLTEAGNLGVGTGFSGVTARLDVHGDVKLGPTGQYWAPGGEEGLRMLRGEVLSGGFVLSGAGFTVNHVATGTYDIVFTTPFASGPSVVVTPASTLNPPTGLRAGVPTTTSGSVRVAIYEEGTGPKDAKFSFIAMGQR